MWDFLKTWGDKLLLVGLIVMFTWVAIRGYDIKNADMASFAADLAKQLVSAILTLLVAARVPWPNKSNGGNTNGTQTNSNTTVPIINH